MKDIVIVGAGAFGRETAQLIEDINADKKTWNLLGFIDETAEKQGEFINGYEVLGNLDELKKNMMAVCAVGNPRDKYNLIKRVSACDVDFASLIHPDAKICKFCDIGIGCIVCLGSFVSVNTKLGNHVSINPLCGIGHDTVVEDYATLYWNVVLSGNVRIRKGCEIGSKADVLPKKSVGKWSVIGAGAVVVNDIPDNCVAVGVPAKPI